jgi:hypothetical protein
MLGNLNLQLNRNDSRGCYLNQAGVDSAASVSASNVDARKELSTSLFLVKQLLPVRRRKCFRARDTWRILSLLRSIQPECFGDDDCNFIREKLWRLDCAMDHKEEWNKKSLPEKSPDLCSPIVGVIMKLWDVAHRLRTDFLKLQRFRPRLTAIPLKEISDGVVVRPLRLADERLVRTADFGCSKSANLSIFLGERLVLHFAICCGIQAPQQNHAAVGGAW